MPLSGDTDTGDRVLSRGTGLRILPVPLHEVIIDCELVKGDCVRPALPIEGVHFVLGNGLAGSQVWADTPPSPVVTSCPSGVVPGALGRCLRSLHLASSHAL